MSTEPKAEAKLVIDGREYDAPSDFTLGEFRMLKRMTGMTVDEYDAAPMDDPDCIAWICWVAMHRENPAVTEADIDNIGLATISSTGGEPEEEEGTEGLPPTAGGTGPLRAVAPPGQETTPADSGLPHSESASA